MKRYNSPTEMIAEAGTTLGTSPWRLVDQQMINVFADLTDDPQWVHVDEVRAKEGPFGATVAHGMLTISLAVSQLGEIVEVGGADMLLNKGMDRLRFSAPVTAGTRIRTTAELVSVTPRIRGFTEIVFGISVEVENTGKVALTAQVRAFAHVAESDESTV